ncbi:MAG: SDR family NAD(P)-dependent oxidoreductase [Deltaproteobacteria bacterium]|nr:SDR family NAD(P)-dependent oxidoreductase [Deltaproteobacteria bacterium]
MQELREKTAVVTGAASGIGRALAERFAEEGMKLVLADVDRGGLEEVAKSLEARGTETLLVPTDVSRPEEVDALADKAFAAFEQVHVVCNNAGVFSGGNSWETPIEDYQWVLGVNTFGVIHGIRSFVPRLIAQDCEAHVVNTASMAGVTTMPFVAAYNMSKHAVVALSEVLYHELTLSQTKVGVSVLCPEAIATRIDDAERNRPDQYHSDPASAAPNPAKEVVANALSETVRGGLDPSVMADRVVKAIRDRRFYILSQEDGWRRCCNTRLDDVREGRNPTFAPPAEGE